MTDTIRMQHEVAAEYHGCSKCKKRIYPYYWGSNRRFYCEDCVKELVSEKKAEYGRHGITAPGLPRPPKKPETCYNEKCIDTRAEVERLRGEVAEQRKQIADDLLNLCLVCCEQPLRSFEEGNEASMGYPIMTGEECCGCPVPKVPKEVIEYIEKLRLEELK